MSFPQELRSECRVEDLLLVTAVPLALVAVYALPEATRRSLVFAYEEPTPLTAYASHFVHLGPEHLLVNLASYLLLVPTAYALAVLGGRRTRFRVGLVAVLLALPFALSWLNLLFVRPRVGFGFSGVAMGCLGLLALELFNYARTSLSLPLSWGDAAVLFFVELALISLAVVPRRRRRSAWRVPRPQSPSPTAGNSSERSTGTRAARWAPVSADSTNPGSPNSAPSGSYSSWRSRSSRSRPPRPATARW